MITSVALKGWRSHKDSKLNFSEGTNVLIGVMGAGKSSLLDAISFALFGTFPSLKAKKLTMDDIIMNRPKKEDMAEVVVSFQVGRDIYTVKRTIVRGKGTKAEIRKNNELIDTGTTRTTENVERILKVSYDLFSRAVYSEQNGLDYFLTVPKGQRMKKMDSLLQIDKFEKARSSTTSLVNRMKNTITDKTRIVEEMEEKEDFDKVSKLKEDIARLEEKQGELKNKMSEVEKEKQKMEKGLEEIKNEMEKIEELEKQRNILSGRIKNLSEEIESFEIKEKIGDLEKKKKEIESVLEDSDKKLKALEDEMSETTEKKQKITVSIEDLISKIDNLKSVKGRCPVCDRELTEKHRKKLIDERSEKVSEKEKELKETIVEIKRIESEIREVKESIEKKKEQKFDIERAIEKIKGIEEKKERLKDFRREEKELESAISEKRKSFDRERMEEIQDKLKELYGSYTEIKVMLSSNERFLNEKREQLQSLEEKKKMFQEYKSQIKKMEVLIDDLKKFEKALKETQITLRSEFVEAVNATMDRIWEYLYPYDDYTSIRLSIQGGDYVLELRESGGNWVSVEGIASGGERTTACLALRIAFALVLAPSLKWLVLDEPTHNLDVQGVEYLATVLRDKISEFIEQVFLITHDEKLEDAVTGYLYKLERKKEKNEPTQVVLISSPKD